MTDPIFNIYNQMMSGTSGDNEFKVEHNGTEQKRKQRGRCFCLLQSAIDIDEEANKKVPNWWAGSAWERRR